MPPLLSILVPAYNYKECLPALLENISGQKFTDFEVVLVDDCSDDPLDDVVEPWKAKGLDIHVYRNTTRQYTKNTRLIGVEHSKGELIMFMDADDALAGTSALGYHVALIQEKDVELLQFQVANYIDGKKIDVRSLEYTKPFPGSMYGAQIFETYAAERMRGHLVYGKIAKRSLWERMLPAARVSSVKRYQEDLFLASLLYFHAQSYFGSDRIGYTRIPVDRTAQKAIGRIATHYAMLTEFLPYLRANGASATAIKNVEAVLLLQLKVHMGFVKERVASEYGYAIPDTLIEEIEEHCSVQNFVKALLIGLSE